MLWNLVELMVGRRDFNRVGPAFVKALTFSEVLLEIREIRKGAF